MGKRQLDTNEFVRRGRLIHGDRFDYSKVIYTNKSANVIIICRIHGEFSQKAENHWHGATCLKCTHEMWSISKNMGLGVFLEKAKRLHGELYDYSLVEYKNNRTPIKIICKKHGEFSHSPNQHLIGYGCGRCSRRFPLTNNEFIRRSLIAHHNRYAYDKCNYVNATTKVIVTCKKHGDFLSVAKNHYFLKVGCPKCMASKGEIAIRVWLNDQSIIFEEQKKMSGCRNKLPLKFDFYLPDLNMMIEYDGRHHYSDIRRRLEYTQKCDTIKNKWCEENGVTMLRIRYDENIEKKLDANVITAK